MKTRIITGIIGVLAIIAIIYIGEIAITTAVGLVSLFALHELMSSLGINKVKTLYYINMVLTALFYVFILAFRVAVSPFINLMPFIFIFYILLIFSTMVFSNGKIKLTDITLTVFSMIYVVFMLMHILFINNINGGIFNVIIILLGAVATDTFAYFVGVTFGKHKLCPAMSPKKTIEGAIGGLLGTVIVFFIYGLIIEKIAEIDVNYVTFMILALGCGLASEIGDLVASVIKRQFGIKDFGDLLPGHGGIMDRVDSIAFVAPVVYYFILVFPVFYIR